MDTSKDDGNPRPVSSSNVLLVLAVLFLFACNKISPYLKKAKKEAVAKQTRTPEKKVARKKSKKKKLYLTFDDGPNKGTKNVIDIVKSEDVSVSFFIVGEHVFASAWQAEHWDSLKSMDNIDLCNHSYSHAHNRYSSYYQYPENVVKDFERTRDSLQLNNSIVRTPGRNIWRIDSLRYTDIKQSAAAADSLSEAGFMVMGWDLEWHYDAKTMSVTTKADKMIEQIDSVFAQNRTKQPNHLILLAHDQVYQKPDDSIQLRQFLQLLKQRDEYELNLVTSYPLTSKKQ